MKASDFIRDRKDRGMSQQAMAVTIGVSVDVIRSLETGRYLQPANALKVADFYEKRVTDIWPIESKAAAA